MELLALVTFATVMTTLSTVSSIYMTVLLTMIVSTFAARHKRLQQHPQPPKIAPLALTEKRAGTHAGKVDNWPVHFCTKRGQRGDQRIVTHCWGAEIQTDTLKLAQRMGRRSRQIIGDPDFDRQLVVKGTLDDLSFLSARLRQLLLPLSFSVGIRIDKGILWIEHEWFSLIYQQQALALAQILSQAPRDPDARLIAMATTDPVASVRRHLLALAAIERPAQAIAIASILRDDEDPSVRTEAALVLLEPEGLLEVITQMTAHPKQRQQAAKLLLRSGSHRQRAIAGEFLAQAQYAFAPVALALLRSAGALGESGLLILLRRARGELLGHVVAALGEVGSVTVVPALRRRQAGLSMLQSGMSSAIDYAVLRIQADSGGQRGGLAIVEAIHETGALSLMTQRGGLSLAEECASDC